MGVCTCIFWINSQLEEKILYAYNRYYSKKSANKRCHNCRLSQQLPLNASFIYTTAPQRDDNSLELRITAINNQNKPLLRANAILPQLVEQAVVCVSAHFARHAATRCVLISQREKKTNIQMNEFHSGDRFRAQSNAINSYGLIPLPSGNGKSGLFERSGAAQHDALVTKLTRLI